MNNWTRDDGVSHSYGYKALNLAVTWAINTDFAHLTWNDIYDGQVTYDVWESQDQGLHWNLIAVTALGANFYDAFTYQNALMQFKVAPHGTSEFCNPVSIQTPLCLWTDQNPIVGGLLNALTVAALHTVHVEWGDGLFNNLVGANPAFPHVYANPGQYCIQLYADIDFITNFDVGSILTYYGNLSKWVLPGNNQYLVLQNCNFTGDLTEWILPASLRQIYLDTNNFTGDIGAWFIGGMPPALTTLQVNPGNAFTGYPNEQLAGATAPNTLILLALAAQNFTGDLKLFNIAAGAGTSDFYLNDNHFASLLRGNYRWVRNMNMANNNCNYKEINDFLAYLDNFFTLGIVPLESLTLTITGANMGSPTGGLLHNPAILSLTAKYIAAGKVFVCVCN